MPVLVSDASMLIDLERGRLLEEMFLLPFEFAVPDLLYARELAGPLGDQLMALGLRVEKLTPTELTRATTVRRFRLRYRRVPAVELAHRQRKSARACSSRTDRNARRALVVRPVCGRQSHCP